MKKFNEWLAGRELMEYEFHVDGDGYAYDDEGNREFVGRQHRGYYRGAEAFKKSGIFKDPKPEAPKPETPRMDSDPRQVDALKKAIMITPNEFLSSILAQVQQGRVLTDAQKKAVRHNFYKLRMKEDADLFR